jgi:hypothetical protein
VLQPLKQLLGTNNPNSRQTKAFTAHCPTRFGILVLIARDIKANKEAIKAACHSDKWAAACSGSTHATAFYDAAALPNTSTTFWRRLDDMLELLQPVTDAIH